MGRREPFVNPHSGLTENYGFLQKNSGGSGFMVCSAVDLFLVFRVIRGQKHNRIFTTDNTEYTDESQSWRCPAKSEASDVANVTRNQFAVAPHQAQGGQPPGLAASATVVLVELSRRWGVERVLPGQD